jgi:hypothetical protein
MAVLGLSCARPAAAWALFLPLALWVLLRLVARPPQRVVGTLELWKELAPVLSEGGRARGRLPPWAWLGALGLFLGALAWVGPRGAGSRATRTWTLVVDLSPSMGLPWDEEATRTRLEAALATAGEWLAGHAERSARVRWQAEGRAPLELARDERPPSAWLAPVDEGGTPDWDLHDRPGTLWITDRAPPRVRRDAGLVASGGVPVPGPIHSDGRESVLWEGGELRKAAREEPAYVRVREAGGALPEVLARVLAAWSAARGFELVDEARAGTLLVVEVRPDEGDGGMDEALDLARDGWRATGRGALGEARGAAPAGEDWLRGTTRAGTAHTVLRAREGVLEVGLRELSEPSGDPALFALSFGRLLDRCARRPAGVVPLEERLGAGAPVLEPGAPPLPDAGTGADAGPQVDAALTLLAALCAGLAYLLRDRR